MPNIDVTCFFCGKVNLEHKSKVDEKKCFFSRLYYVNEGEALYRDENGEKLLQEGRIYLLPSKTYSVTNTKRGLFYHTWFHIITKTFTISDIIEFDVKKNPFIEKYLTLLTLLVDDNLTNEQIIDVDCEIFESIDLIIQSLFKAIDAYEQFEFGHSHQIRTVIKYIVDHLDRDLSNAELAKIAILNKFYFIKLFKQECNMSPQKFIIISRMNQAKSMLLNDNCIKEVSSRLGYSDQKSFSRAFKRIVGISPSHYKRLSQ